MEYTIKEIEACKTWQDYENLLTKYDNFDEQLALFDANELRRVDKLLLAVIRGGNAKLMKLVVRSVVKQRSMIDWKKRSDLVSEIVNVIKANVENTRESDCKKMHGSFLKTFIKVLKAQNLLEKYLPKLFEIVEAALKTSDNDASIHHAAFACVTQFPWREHLSFAAIGTILFADYFIANANLPSDCNPLISWYSFMTVTYTTSGYGLTLPPHCPTSPLGVSNFGELYAFVLPQMSQLFNFFAAKLKRCSKKSEKQLCSFVLSTIMEAYLQDGAIDIAVLQPVLRQLVELWNHDSDSIESLQQNAGQIVITVAGKEPALLVDCSDKLLAYFLDGQAASIVNSLPKMYELAPQKLEAKLEDLVRKMSEDCECVAALIQLLTLVAKRSPQLIERHHIEAVFKSVKQAPIVFLEELASQKPEKVAVFESRLLEYMKGESTPTLLVAANVLVKLATDESKADAYLKLFAERLNSQAQGDTQATTHLLCCIRSIGLNFPNLLVSHRSSIEKLASLPAYRDYCKSIINLM